MLTEQSFLSSDYLDPYLSFKTKSHQVVDIDSFRSVLKLTMTYPMEQYYE